MTEGHFHESCKREQFSLIWNPRRRKPFRWVLFIWSLSLMRFRWSFVPKNYKQWHDITMPDYSHSTANGSDVTALFDIFFLAKIKISWDLDAPLGLGSWIHASDLMQIPMDGFGREGNQRLTQLQSGSEWKPRFHFLFGIIQGGCNGRTASFIEVRVKRLLWGLQQGRLEGDGAWIHAQEDIHSLEAIALPACSEWHNRLALAGASLPHHLRRLQ